METSDFLFNKYLRPLPLAHQFFETIPIPYPQSPLTLPYFDIPAN